LPKCNETLQIVRWNNRFADKIKFNEVMTDGGTTCVINSRPAVISQR
jgi:hypothetical protein